MAGEIKQNRHLTGFINGWEGAKQVIWLGAFLLFFGILWYVAPIGIYPDSGSYISMQAGREPLYPLFLAFFRTLFHEADTIVWLASSGQLESQKAMDLIAAWPALKTAMLVQSLFAAIACFYLARTIKKIFALSAGMTVLVSLCTLIPYILTPLASASHMMLNKAVLTEGLAFPLFYLFTASMIRGLFQKEMRVRSYALAFLWALLLVLTRNQMLTAFAIWCAVLLFTVLRDKSLRGISLVCVAVFLFFGIRTGCNEIYNVLVHTGYEGTATGSYNILTTLLYLSDASNVDSLTDEGEKDLFLQIHGQMEQEGMTRADAPDGILNAAYHYEDCYDRIGFEIQQPMLFAYAREKDIPEGEVLNEVVRMAAEMDKQLFPQLLGAYASNYFATVVSGLTRSISASGTVMGIYSAILYLLAIVLALYLYHTDRQSKEAGLMLFSLFMIAVNVSATALMIMCLSRYMIYNTALFYIAGLLCLARLYEQLRKSRLQKKGN